MTKLDSIPPSVTYSSASHFDRRRAPWLIVLFPDSADDPPRLSHRIWEIANSSGLNVLLLSLCTDTGKEPWLRRQLVTMAASIKDINISTEIRIERGSDWVGLAKGTYQPGDVIACYADQKVGLLNRSLHEILRSQLEAPIYVLSEDQPVRNLGARWLCPVLFWIGSLLIIGGFFWLQIKIMELPKDWAQTLLLSISVIGEIGVIWLWNSIFPQSQ